MILSLPEASLNVYFSKLLYVSNTVDWPLVLKGIYCSRSVGAAMGLWIASNCRTACEMHQMWSQNVCTYEGQIASSNKNSSLLPYELVCHKSINQQVYSRNYSRAEGQSDHQQKDIGAARNKVANSIGIWENAFSAVFVMDLHICITAEWINCIPTAYKEIWEDNIFHWWW